MGEPSTQPEPRRSRDIHPDDVVSAMMLLFRVLLLALFLGQIAHGRIGGPDVERFRTIALHAGTPWRDFPVEYARFRRSSFGWCSARHSTPTRPSWR